MARAVGGPATALGPGAYCPARSRGRRRGAAAAQAGLYAARRAATGLCTSSTIRYDQVYISTELILTWLFLHFVGSHAGW